jgi:hypothetical protein
MTSPVNSAPAEAREAPGPQLRRNLHRPASYDGKYLPRKRPTSKNCSPEPVRTGYSAGRTAHQTRSIFAPIRYGARSERGRVGVSTTDRGVARHRRAPYVAGTVHRRDLRWPSLPGPGCPWRCLDEAFSNALLKHDLTAGTVQGRQLGMDATAGEAVFAPAARCRRGRRLRDGLCAQSQPGAADLVILAA